MNYATATTTLSLRFGLPCPTMLGAVLCRVLQCYDTAMHCTAIM